MVRGCAFVNGLPLFPRAWSFGRFADNQEDVKCRETAWEVTLGKLTYRELKSHVSGGIVDMDCATFGSDGWS